MNEDKDIQKELLDIEKQAFDEMFDAENEATWEIDGTLLTDLACTGK